MLSVWIYLLLCWVSQFIYFYAKCRYTECHNSFNFKLNVVMLSVAIHLFLLLSVAIHLFLCWMSLSWMSLCWMSWCPQIGFRAFWSNAIWPKHIWTTQLLTQSFGHQLIFLCADQTSVGQVIFDHKTRDHRRVWNFYFVGHWTWFVVCTGIK
jgi:hypothetical protein